MLISSFKNYKSFRDILIQPFVNPFSFENVNSPKSVYAYQNSVLKDLLDRDKFDLIINSYIPSFPLPYAVEDFMSLNFSSEYSDNVAIYFFREIENIYTEEELNSFSSSYQSNFILNPFRIVYSGSYVSFHTDFYPYLYPSLFNHLFTFLKKINLVKQIGKGRGKLLVIDFSQIYSNAENIFSQYQSFLDEIDHGARFSLKSHKRDINYASSYITHLYKENQYLSKEYEKINSHYLTSSLHTWH